MNTGLKVWTWFCAVTLTFGMMYVVGDRGGDFFTKAIAISWGAWAIWAAVKIQNYPELRKIEVEEIRSS